MAGSGDGTRWAERAAALVDVVREVAATGPPPKGRPFFGLDHRSGTALELVEDLATRGIFRKYEHVLDLGGGLGRRRAIWRRGSGARRRRRRRIRPRRARGGC